MKSGQLCALASTRPRPAGRVGEKPGNDVCSLDTYIEALPKTSTTEIYLERYCVTRNEPIKHTIIKRYKKVLCGVFSDVIVGQNMNKTPNSQFS